MSDNSELNFFRLVSPICRDSNSFSVYCQQTLTYIRTMARGRTPISVAVVGIGLVGAEFVDQVLALTDGQAKIISLSSSSPTRLPPSTLSLRLVNRGVHSFAKRHSFLAFFSRPCIPPRPHFWSILILWQTIYQRPPRLWPVVPRSLRMSLTPYMPIHRRRRPVN